MWRTSPQGGAHRHFPLTGRSPREQQVRDVCAGDEQNEQDGARQHDEHRADASGCTGAQRLEVHLQTQVPRIDVRALALKFGCHPADVVVGLRKRDARLEPGNEPDREISGAVLDFARSEGHRHPERRRFAHTGRCERKFEARRHDSDDGVRALVQPYDGADGFSVAAEAALPELMAQDDDIVGARSILRLSKGTPGDW